MSSKRVDRRVQKTLKLLHEALMSLVVEKRYELISVQEILDRANVGRSTFYTHYRHKDELLLKAFDGLREELGAAQAGTAGRACERIIGFSRTMFVHAQGYRRVYGALIRSQAGPIVRQRIQRMVSDLIRIEIKKRPYRNPKAEAALPSELLIHYLASTMIAMLEWWIGDRNDLSPDAMNSAYRRLVLPALSPLE